jgi:hypothetical protein
MARRDEEPQRIAAGILESGDVNLEGAAQPE